MNESHTWYLLETFQPQQSDFTGVSCDPGGPIECPLKRLPTPQNYGIGGIKGSPQLDPHYTERRKSIGKSMSIFSVCIHKIKNKIGNSLFSDCHENNAWNCIIGWSFYGHAGMSIIYGHACIDMVSNTDTIIYDNLMHCFHGNLKINYCRFFLDLIDCSIYWRNSSTWMLIK